MDGLLHRNRAVNDFLKWYWEEKPKQIPRVGEGLPSGVDPLTSRYGTFGAKAELDGGPLDVNKVDARYRQPACEDSEAQPPAPCAATGECGDLLQLAHKFTNAMNQATMASRQAIDAIQYSKLMQQRASIALKRGAMSRFVSNLAADTDPEDWWDIPTKRLYGPYREPPGMSPYNDSVKFIIPRLQERWREDKRIALYLQRAENLDPLQLPLLRPGRTSELGDGPIKNAWTRTVVDSAPEFISPTLGVPLVKFEDPVEVRSTSEGDTVEGDEYGGKVVKSCAPAIPMWMTPPQIGVCLHARKLNGREWSCGSRHKRKGRRNLPWLDQPALAAFLDITLAAEAMREDAFLGSC